MSKNRIPPQKIADGTTVEYDPAAEPVVVRGERWTTLYPVDECDTKRGEVMAPRGGELLCAYTDRAGIKRRQRSALTRAVNSKDPAKVEAACRTAVAEWNEPGMMWPDDWSRWQRAMDAAYGVFRVAPRLEDLT